MFIRIRGTFLNETLGNRNSYDNQIVEGMGGNDTLYGGYGNDRLMGGPGNDLLYSAAGLNTLVGGPGNDTYRYVSANAPSTSYVVELPNGGYDTVYYDTAMIRAYVPDNVEAVYIRSSVRFFHGNDQANLIDASASSGELTLFAGAGNDTVIGTRYQDYLDGGTGADRLVGGAGSDQYIVDHIGDMVVETQAGTAGGSFDTVRASVNYTLAPNVETLYLIGTALNGGGNALNNGIHGNDRNNLLSGFAGDDVLLGNGGNDTLRGGAGADTLDGGAGVDVVWGDAGSDVFVFDTMSRTAGMAERIGDLTAEDLIDLSAIDGNALVAGSQALSYIGTGQFTGAAGELRYNGSFLLADTNGDKVPDLFLQIGQGKAGFVADTLLL